MFQKSNDSPFTIMVNISTKDRKLIEARKKMVILQKRIPKSVRMLYPRRLDYKVYLFEDSRGVFAETKCQIFIPSKYYFSKDDADYILKNQEKYQDKIAKIWDSIQKVDLTGTCLSHQELMQITKLRPFCFMDIKEINFFCSPLSLDAFYFGEFGKNGWFEPSEKYTKPYGWCYALRKKESL